jgi:DNA-directed RNA polymerase specialized sigma24 family protein
MNVLAALESAQLPCRRRFALWVASEPVLGGLDPRQLRVVLLDTSGEVDFERRDDLLAALVRLSRIDDEAGTLLLACLLPGLRRRISRHGWGLDREEAVSEALVALWRRIKTYPLHRRPRRIAMNLLLDAAHDLIEARNRELDWRAHTYLTDRAIPRPESRSPDLFWVAARRAGVLNEREIALIHSTRVHDLPIGQVAPLVGMSRDAARKARQRAIHKLKAWWNIDQRVA